MPNPTCLKCLVAFAVFCLVFGLPLAYWFWVAPEEDYPGQYG